MINILLIDDIETNVSMLKFVIQSYFDKKKIEHHIDIAENGLEAVGLFFIKQYDIIFLDIIMPKYDGYGVLKTIRHSDKKVLPYICMVTAVTDENQIELFKENGANSYIIKPFENAIIHQVLDTALSAKNNTSSNLSELAGMNSQGELINFEFIDFYDK